MTMKRQIVRVAEPHVASMASLVLLTRDYRKGEMEAYLALREALMDECEAQNGCLRCHYCGREDLLREQPETTYRQPANLATVDHVVPVSKGGDKFDKDNCVIACHACNEKKADRMPV